MDFIYLYEFIRYKNKAFAFLKDAAELRLSAPTDQKIGSSTGSATLGYDSRGGYILPKIIFISQVTLLTDVYFSPAGGQEIVPSQDADSSLR